MDKEAYLKISRSQNACASCGAVFEDAGKHPSAILPATQPIDEEEEGQPLREDYCLECWEKLRREKDYFGFWLSRREKTDKPKSLSRKERNATLLSYFEYLYQQKDPQYSEHLFFLSHLLMKFSVLRWLRSEPASEPGGNERIVFRNTVTDDLVTIESVPLHDDNLARIKAEIDEYLSRSLEETA